MDYTTLTAERCALDFRRSFRETVMERELKMQFPAGQAKKLRESPFLASLLTEAPHTERLFSTYFDTDDLALYRCGASLRVRTAGDHHVQTLKTNGSPRAGLYEREEIECTLNGKAPDPAALPVDNLKDSNIGKLLRDADLVNRLKPVFVTEVERSVSLLRLPEGDEIELALDEGAVKAGEAAAPIREVEMELKHGEPDHLYQFALDLLETVPLSIGYASKGSRGYELVVQQHSEPVRAEPLKLKKADTVEQAFRRVAENCLAQIHGNERGVVSGHDPSCVHQMRVGLRRLRSALDLFEGVITAPPFFQEELRWIAGELGAARDWEVIANATLPTAFDGAPDDTHAAAVTQAAREIAKENRSRAAAAVDSVRYTRLILELTRWLHQASWRASLNDDKRATLNRSIVKFAGKTLSRRHERLLKRGRNLPDLDPHRRHRARIAAKKLRYATEFFASLYPKQVVRHYVASLSKLQDDLGWRNDVVVADGLLKTLASERQATATGVGYARGYLASRVAADHDALQVLWKRFRRLSPPH
ncbi:CYTH and CHAD domain-containing protein [Burkholderia sp. WSM2230]|uniref:CYTH and CHAD domain-containing protein n=1 Tax=Burkholderia sp. WSM2230 TaxID=944435 RepID=UPI001E643405|nr:CYTH and CHAD domain-containing protein [Burkholderia sp. WSM2230]